MVYQKKSTLKGKQQTPAKTKKKAIEEESNIEDMDMDFNEDSGDSESDDQIVKKTPASKTPKGKQPQSDKRVSFQIPGKSTPANKTPKTSLVGKKQPTPAKASALKEFRGMLATDSAKKNGKSKRPAPEDDDDDDDDDEEDDDEEDDDDDDNADADLDMLGDFDDDDDDDDDEDDDDDDEEGDEDEEGEEDEEEEVKQPKNKQNAKQQNKTKNSVKIEVSDVLNKIPKTLEKTPAKNADKARKGDVKKEQEPSKVVSAKKDVNPALKNYLEFDAERRKERDRRTLFVGNLPKDITQTELKALSADILNVNLPHCQKKMRHAFAFLEFASESKAEENFKLLKTKKLRDEPLTIDYSGEKSQKKKFVGPEQSEKPFNLRKLYLATLPVESTMDQVAKFFPKAIQINFNTNPTFRNATVLFLNEEDAAAALESTKSAKLGGKPISVMYSIQRDNKVKKRKRPRGKKQPGAKKAKLEVSQESDGDDDDDDDDDDE